MFCSAEIDKRSEAIYQFGFVLSKFAEVNVIGINRSPVDRDIARIEFYDPIRNCNTTTSIDIKNCDVPEALDKILQLIRGKEN